MNRLDVYKRAEHPINNASILITGGTGSFGSHFAKHILTQYNSDRVIIFSLDELKQWQMREEEPLFQDPRQVPAAEYNPTECILTNVIGTMNCINAALESNVRQIIALSTDKDVNPINLYGATKLCSDKLFLAGNAYSRRKTALFHITLDEAVSFVTMALQEQEGAEVFAPKSPSISIRSISQAIYPEHPINITGNRP
ncbi:hypothetical protein ACTFIW_003742 [Dictyostelium discoideum]